MWIAVEAQKRLRRGPETDAMEPLIQNVTNVLRYERDKCAGT
jgi:hypothetical protein